jgi:hypothetical protein
MAGIGLFGDLIGLANKVQREEGIKADLDEI